MGSCNSSHASVTQGEDLLKFLKLSPLSLALNDHCLEQFAECFELIHVKPNGNVLSQHSIGGSLCSYGDYFVVGEGQIDISVKVPTVNKKTDYTREVLCTKRQGDILYIPAIENLACSIGLEASSVKPMKETSQFNRVKRRSAELVSIMLQSIKSTQLQSSFTNLEPESFQDKTNVRGGSLNGGVSLKNMRKPMKMLGMTSSISPYGAILLRLNREKFDIFREKAQEEATLESLVAGEDSSFSTQGSLGSPVRQPFKSSLFSVLKKIQIAPEQTKEQYMKRKRVSKIDLEFLSVMMTSNIQDHLKRISFLKDLPMSKIQTLGEMSVFEVIPPNTLVCEEGQEVYKLHEQLHLYFAIIYICLFIYLLHFINLYSTPLSLSCVFRAIVCIS